jgi:hypothetical protein
MGNYAFNHNTQLPENFNPEEHEGSKFELLPVGEYIAQITDSCVVPTKAGDGHRIGLTWQIVEGDYENRYVFENITFSHPNEMAVAIGRRQLKDLCAACGIDDPVTDVSVFRLIPCRIKVGIEKDKTGLYEDKNKVTRVLPLEGPHKAAATTAKAGASAKPSAKPAAPRASNGPGAAAWNAAPAKQEQKRRPLSEVIGDSLPL